MPPPSNSSALTLTLLPTPFFVLQAPTLSPALLAAISAPTAPGFLSITRTPTEISVAGEMGAGAPAGAEAKWRAIRVRGPMAHDLTGVLAALSAPLAKAGVPIFALSTWWVASTTPEGAC
jgi:hypothetical protein